MIDLGDEATVRHLHSGCALIVCTVSADGRPYAARGWGLTVVDAAGQRVRLLLEAADEPTVAAAAAGAAIAVTATAVATSQSLQLKGRAVGLEPATPEDEARFVQYSNDFIDDVATVNNYPREVVERVRPLGAVVACTVEIDAAFIQTPGPSAGIAIGQRPL